MNYNGAVLKIETNCGIAIKCGKTLAVVLSIKKRRAAVFQNFIISWAVNPAS
jgi:hypothetical protein